MKTSNVFLVITFVFLYVLLVYLPFTVVNLSFDVRMWTDSTRLGFARAAGIPLAIFGACCLIRSLNIEVE